MRPELLNLLRCPETGQRLTLAPAEAVVEIETRRQAGLVRVAAAEPQLDLSTPIEALLIREDGRIAYAVQRGVPVLLPGHGVALPR